MIKRTISAVIGKGDVFHNNRKIVTENVNRNKISDNITIVNHDVKSVYHELFDDALTEYNAKQTRKDRIIKDYHEHIRHSRQEKEFHEVIFQIGNRNDTHIGTDDAEICADILKKFAENFQSRNPHLRVFNAVIHMDEETPHLHIDFVPFATGQKRGLSTRVSLTKALEQQGFKGEGKLNTASKLWIDNEKKILADLMSERGIEWEQLGTDNQHLSVLNYKKQERQKEIAQLDNEITEKKQKRNEILQYVPDYEKTEKAEQRLREYCEELTELVKNPISAVKNKKKISLITEKMQKSVTAAHRAREKSENKAYEAVIENHKFFEMNNELSEKNEQLSQQNNQYRSEIKELRAEISVMHELIEILKHIARPVYDKINEIARQKAVQREELRNTVKKKKSYEIE